MWRLFQASVDLASGCCIIKKYLLLLSDGILQLHSFLTQTSRSKLKPSRLQLDAEHITSEKQKEDITRREAE